MLACALLVHWPGLHAGALSFDDSEYLTDNPLVRNPSLPHAGRFLREVLEPSTVHGYYQPLTMISLMVDYALGGRPEHLLPFHRTSLLLHLANTLLVMLIMRMLFRSDAAAAVAGLLFGVHPMTVETIVWVGERKTVLAAFFAFACVATHIRYARIRESGGRGWRGTVPYAAGLLLFTLALMSKPTVTPLPACLLLLDYWPLNRLGRRAILEKVPYFVIAAASAYITFESQKRTAVALLPGEDPTVFLPYVLAHNVIFYLWKVVVPVQLSSHYAYPPLTMSRPAVAAGVIGTAILIPLLLLSWRWTRALITGWAFFFVAIFPAMGVIGFTNVIAADKYAYWPALGFLLIVAWLITSLDRERDAYRLTPALKGALAAVLLTAVAFGLATRSYLRHWRTTETLFRYMLSLDEDAAAPLIQYAMELDRQGRTTEALPYHQKAALAAPEFEGTHYNLGNALQRLGRHDPAVTSFRNAIRVKPGFADAYNNMGNALLARGDAPGAKSAYREAIRLKPEHADAHYNLANVLLQEGDRPGAMEQYETALRLNPDHFAAHKNLAGVLWEQGRFGPAVEHYEAALRLRQPEDLAVLIQLAGFYAEPPDPAFRRPERAADLGRRAIQRAESSGDHELAEQLRRRWLRTQALPGQQ